MAELKTKPTDANVKEFLNAVPDPIRRADGLALARLMQKLTGAKPKIWGTGIVAFGEYRYKYATGREGDWFVAGFAVRKSNLTLYLIGGLDRELLKKLGKHKLSGSCLHIATLANVDRKVLAELIETSMARLQGIIAERKKAAAQ
ncbi:MAG: DUF1801 domain-containing protein [Acidobacteriota bacterium]